MIGAKTPIADLTRKNPARRFVATTQLLHTYHS